MWDELYSQPIAKHAEGTGTVSIDIQACFQNAFGTGVRREAMLWQRIPNPETVLHLLTHDLDPEMRKPGTYMFTFPTISMTPAACLLIRFGILSEKS